MTIGGWWIGLVIGIIFGTLTGFIAGGMIVDSYWKKRVEKLENDLRNAYKAPYIVEPKDKQYFL